MHPTQYTYEETLIGLPNVVINDSQHKNRNNANDRYVTNTSLYKTLKPLVDNKPNWKFVANGFTSRNNDAGGFDIIATRFRIHCDGEYLGEVWIEYHGRSYKIAVSNHRIQAERERRNGYRTENHERATLQIRKKFYPKGLNERVDQAFDSISRSLSDHFTDASGVVWNRQKKFLSKAEAFVLAKVNDYIDMFNLHKESQELAESQVKKDTVELVNNSFRNHKGTIVLVDGLLYIVKVGEEQPITKADNELDEVTRMKLGMLKLVDDGELISNVGVKVNDRTFFLVGEQQ